MGGHSLAQTQGHMTDPTAGAVLVTLHRHRLQNRIWSCGSGQELSWTYTLPCLRLQLHCGLQRRTQAGVFPRVLAASQAAPPNSTPPGAFPLRLGHRCCQAAQGRSLWFT